MTKPDAPVCAVNNPDTPLAIADCHQTQRITRWDQGAVKQGDDEVAQEFAIALTYNGISHVVMMASPLNLEDFALGFSLTEGIIQSDTELYDLELNHHEQGIEISMTISTQRFAALKEKRRNLTGRTGCGLCGAETLTDAIRPTASVPKRQPISDAVIQNALQQLRENQVLQEITGAVHGAAWCDLEGNIQLLREDVGRHNALDKLIGALTKAKVDLDQGFTLITSRASYEMVQKTTSMGISTLVAVSAPTALAIDLATKAGLSLVGFARPGRHVTYA